MDSTSSKTSLGKKLTAVALCVTAFVFLSFSVFADTPVQPLQVVTYSDTTTNVRISGTAERLHYNVDSFQVVFMNPPNNYGTSCTPVLVSFRFYNASDIPAYVGQPEFELTATSGTGAVNTIIYGYDQISTDLFVAESSYSTAEVGRIGIGASNNFSYYTGFVIPPRTSLYFSCIVYVNASAYGQNNTGATEDVNQVTLSALNLYTNQVSFSSDYPYYGEPIDFSGIIEAIENVGDTVSTQSQMTDLINACTYTGSNYTYQSASSIYSRLSQMPFPDQESGNNIIVIRMVGKPYLINEVVNYNNNTDTYSYDQTVRVPYYIYIKIQNNKTKAIRCRYYNYINNLFPSFNNISGQIYVDDYYSDLYSNFYATSSGTEFYFKHTIHVGNTNYGYVPIGEHLTVIRGHIDVPNGTNLTWNTPTVDSFNNSSTLLDGYYPSDEYTILRDLYIAYSSVNGLDDIDDTTDDIKDKSESAHTQEQTYFTQNAQAIQQTGLSNYRFNTDQENGISSVSHDFILVWNALGGFNSVYIFSLTLSLALMILRHAPNAIKSSRRNKEE